MSTSADTHATIAVWPEAPEGAADGADTVHITPFLLGHGGTQATRRALIVLPGGGYRMRAEHEGEPIARWVNSLGYHAFVVSYRVAPHRHPAPMQDAHRAIRIVRHRASEWGIDPDGIGIIGFSAGGHLVATVSTQFDLGRVDATDPILRVSCRPDFAILCYPVISFVEEVHQGCIDNLLGPGADVASRRAMSAELNVTADTPPSFIWHTGEDQSVPVNHPLVYARA
ncbi:MAG: alpha/beta hydrolase, partial [Proteobacteria bacterium]|nr:alpha/beta hydrolase [Pseudomonadota bacterium]